MRFVQNQQEKLMREWNAKRDPLPDKKDANRFKEFLKQKYVQKRFCEESKLDGESDSSEEERRRKKARKEKKKEKKRAKKVESSASQDSDDGQEEIVVQPKSKPEAINPRKLGQPPGFRPVANAKSSGGAPQ